MIDIHLGRKLYPSRESPQRLAERWSTRLRRLFKVASDLLEQGYETAEFLSAQSRHGDL